MNTGTDPHAPAPDANATFLALAQTKLLTRQVSALIRLGRAELLDTIDGT